MQGGCCSNSFDLESLLTYHFCIINDYCFVVVYKKEQKKCKKIFKSWEEKFFTFCQLNSRCDFLSSCTRTNVYIE